MNVTRTTLALLGAQVWRARGRNGTIDYALIIDGVAYAVNTFGELDSWPYVGNGERTLKFYDDGGNSKKLVPLRNVPDVWIERLYNIYMEHENGNTQGTTDEL